MSIMLLFVSGISPVIGANVLAKVVIFRGFTTMTGLHNSPASPGVASCPGLSNHKKHGSPQAV